MMSAMKMKKKEVVVGVGSLCMLLMLLSSSSVMLVNYLAATTTSTDVDAPGGISTASSPFRQQENTGSMKMSHSSSSRASGTTTGRKLLKASRPNSGSHGGVGGEVSLEDYQPIDPSPSSSSKAIRPGPIQHGTHLNPYIPNKPPSPAPNHPKP